MSMVERDQERELATLIAELRRYGVTYLISVAPARGVTEPAPPLSPKQLLRALARASEPRVRDATISLLLLHPELSGAVHAVIAQARASGNERVAERLITLALAALYMRRAWYALLTLALGRAPNLREQPFERYWRARGLPPPCVGDGVVGVRRLADWECLNAGGAYVNYEDDWRNQVHHLIAQECARRPLGELIFPVDGRLLPPPCEEGARAEAPERGDERMSMRPDVTRAEIETFLRELGRSVRQPGRIYLAGGAALVHAQIRGQGAATLDIDLKLDVADEQEVENAIRQLKTRLGVNVELASPADFIPLPPAWERMSQYVGRYGPLDVFYFDFVTLALAKIDRGSSRDLRDVELLKAQGRIRRDQLEAAFQAIQPQLGHGRYFNHDPALFARKLAIVTQQLWGTP